MRTVIPSLLIIFAVTTCDPVGEPVFLPESYNAGQIIEPDAGYIRLDCYQSARLPDTLALYCFDDDERTNNIVVDSRGKHNATIIGTYTRSIQGPACCGIALQFSETNTSSYIEIPDSSDWDLVQGSISFWFRVNACPIQGQDQYLVSRASEDGAETGHIGIFIQPGCYLSVRLEGDDSEVQVRAGSPITPGQWSHININFGSPEFELYVDGKLVGTNPVVFGTGGNRNPWVIGADTRGAKPGSAIPPAHFLTGAAIDLLRISSTRNKLDTLK
jgi:hypothetical protein